MTWEEVKIEYINNLIKNLSLEKTLAQNKLYANSFHHLKKR